MRLDVVGVAVVAVLVVGRDHLRSAVADQGDEVVGGLQQVGGPERAVGQLVAGNRSALVVGGHAGVVVPALASQPHVVGDADDLERLREFIHAFRAQLLGGVALPFGHQDLTQLAQRAGDQCHPGALVDVTRHGGGRLR